jgi:hypothetical protein
MISRPPAKQNPHYNPMVRHLNDRWFNKKQQWNFEKTEIA